MANVNVGITVTWTGDQAFAALQRMERMLEETVQLLTVLMSRADRFADTMAAGMRRVDNEVTKTNRNLNVMGSLMRVIGVFAGLTFIANIFRNVSLWVMRVTGDFQALQTQMVLTEGTFEAAGRQIQDLSIRFLQMGVDAKEGIGLYNRLALLGVENARGLSLAVGGLASTFGLSADAISRTSMAISQMFSKGEFVRAEEFNQQLSEALPQAAAVAAEGFRSLGNTALDTTQEIQRAVQSGTLRVQDFADALEAGSRSFINTAAQVINIRVQYEGLVAAVGVATARMMTQSGVAQALGIIFNRLTNLLLGTADANSNVEKTAAEVEAELQLLATRVADTILGLLKFIGVVEANVRVFGALGSAVVNFGMVLVSTLAYLISPITKFGEILGKALIGDFQGAADAAVNFGSHADVALRSVQNSARLLGRDIAFLSDPDRWTSGTQALARSIGGREGILNILREAQRPSQVTPGGGGVAPVVDDQAAREAERLAQRLTELLENMQRLGEETDRLTRGPLSELEEVIASARDPFDTLTGRITDLRSDFERLGVSTEILNPILAELDAVQARVSASADRAAQSAQRLFEIQRQRADLGTQGQVEQVQERVRDLAERVTIVWRSEGEQQLLDAERDLQRRRAEEVRRLSDLELQYQELMTRGLDAQATSLLPLIIAQQEYVAQLQQMDPALVVATDRMRKMMDALHSSVSGALSDLIVGLTDFNNFDFGEWAENLVNNVTRAIANQWAEQLTDFIFEKFLGGRRQTVQNMTVQNMTVAGGMGAPGGAPGAPGGGLMGWISSMFGNAGAAASGGGGIGGFFASIGSAIAQAVPFFADGGILGGPTLFGVGGEGGQKEGVLPLERIGGKLGVSATGTGDTYNANITIQAIDTQSGMDFLHKNAGFIVGAVNEQWNMGRRTA